MFFVRAWDARVQPDVALRIFSTRASYNFGRIRRLKYPYFWVSAFPSCTKINTLSISQWSEYAFPSGQFFCHMVNEVAPSGSQGFPMQSAPLPAACVCHGAKGLLTISSWSSANGPWTSYVAWRRTALPGRRGSLVFNGSGRTRRTNKRRCYQFTVASLLCNGQSPPTHPIMGHTPDYGAHFGRLSGS